MSGQHIIVVSLFIVLLTVKSEMSMTVEVYSVFVVGEQVFERNRSFLTSDF